MDERAIFMGAMAQENLAQRSDYLDKACAGDDAIRQRVEAMLAAYEQVGSFLRMPVPERLADGLSVPGWLNETVTRSRVPQCRPDALLGKAIETTSSAECPGSRIGPYKLLQEIGEGGMGTVWMAEQIEPIQRRVAIKVVKEGMDSKSVLARFDAERQALAVMEHPNIAKVLDAGQTPSGRPYFVMELVKGRPIKDYCDEKRLGVRERLELFSDVCRAVQHAHQKGIIHRDLKPSNVLVAPYDGKPVVKVIDFGLAKATGQQLTDKTLFTGFGSLVGTPEYMSPEQAEINNQDIDTRSDIYSLGVLLYELLTGSTPLTRKRIKGTALLEVLRVIREEEPPRPSTRLSESKDSLISISAQRQTEPAKLTKLVRGELDWIVMKTLEKDRNRRYETANALAMDVQRYLTDEPVLACPPSAWYRLRKIVRRNKGLLTAVTVVFMTLIAGMGIATWQAIRATLAEKRTLAGFRMARDAVDRSFTQASQSPILRAQSMEKFRRDQLQNAKDFYERFVRERFDAPEVRYDLGLAHHRLAAIDLELGNYSSAEESAGRAIKVLSALTDAHPNMPEYSRDLAAVYVTLGLVYSDSARWDEAEKAYRQAILHQEKQHATHPQSSQYRYALAKTLTASGVTLSRAEHTDKAASRYREALDVLSSAGNGNELDPEHQLLMAQTQMHMGVVSNVKGQYGAAETALIEAARLYRGLVRGQSDPDIETSQSLARCLAILGRTYTDGSRFEKADEAQQQALQVFEKLALEHPDVQVFGYDLGRCYFEMANTSDKVGQPVTARTRYEKATEILDGVSSKGYAAARRVATAARIGRATTFTSEGNHGRATDEAESIVRLKDLTSVNVYDIACLFARSTKSADFDPNLSPADRTRLKERYADRAMDFLRDAVGRGYEHPIAIRADSDLEALRSRNDFRKLIADLETRQKTSDGGRTSQ